MKDMRTKTRAWAAGFATVLVTACGPALTEDSAGGGSALARPTSAADGPSAEGGTAKTEPSSIVVAGLTNLRDLGGKSTPDGSVRTGRLFRSEQLGGLTDVGAWNALGVREIIDFRGTPEIALVPDPDLPPAKSVPMPIFDEAHPDDDLGAQLTAKMAALSTATSAQDEARIEAARADLDAWSSTLHDRMISSYEAFVADEMPTREFAAFLGRLLEGKVTSFHCVSGKDRTGFAAAIVLRGLGVSWKDTLADFMESDARLAAANEAKIAALGQIWTDQPGHASVTSLRTILGVDPSYLTASFAKLQDLYGGATPPANGDVASDEAIANYYKVVVGPGAQDQLKAELVVGR